MFSFNVISGGQTIIKKKEIVSKFEQIMMIIIIIKHS